MKNFIRDFLKTNRLVGLNFHTLPKVIQQAVWDYASCNTYTDEGTIFIADDGVIRHFTTSFSEGKICFEILDEQRKKIASLKSKRDIQEHGRALHIPDELLLVPRVLSGGDIKPLFDYVLTERDTKKDSKKLVSVTYESRTTPSKTLKVITGKPMGCIFRMSIQNREQTLAVLSIGKSLLGFENGKAREFLPPDEIVEF